MAQTVTSPLFSLNWKDALKGVLVAAVSAALTGVYNALTVVPPHIDWKQIGVVGITAGVAYLVKNFLTPAQVVTKLSETDLSDPDKPKPDKP